MAVWRYSGFLMGIPETILFRDEAEALRIFEVGNLCEPAPDWDCAVMANSLVNAAPLVAGITDPAGRRDLANYVYSVSRALIGDALADSLKYPRRSTFGVLPWFRLQGRYNRMVGMVLPAVRAAQQLHQLHRVDGGVGVRRGRDQLPDAGSRA